MAEGSSKVMVSIIIVSWNARDFLVQCLNSLSAKVCRYPFEIIVVDNASSDGSADCVADGFPHVKLVRNSANLGFAKGNNVGVAASRGQYLCLINSDIKVLPDCITRLVDYCEEHPKVGMAGPRVIGGDGKMQRSCWGTPTIWNMLWRALALDTMLPWCSLFNGFSLKHWPQDSLKPVGVLSGCFWLVRRQAVAQVGLLDASFFMYAEDMDWCKRFWELGWQVVFVPAAEAIHYGGGSSANAPVRFYIEKHRASLQYWRKHHSRFSAACFFLILCLHLSLRAAGHFAALLLNGRLHQISLYKLKRSLACLKWLLSGGFHRSVP
jgi:hypothetical protein